MDSEVKLPLVQQTAPERIWLAVSDEPHNAGERFPEPHEDLCWSDDEPLAVCVPYVRADLAQPTRDAAGVAGIEIINELHDAENEITILERQAADHARIVAEKDAEAAESRQYAADAACRVLKAELAQRRAEQRAEAMAGLLREWLDWFTGKAGLPSGFANRVADALTGQATPEGS